MKKRYDKDRLKEAYKQFIILKHGKEALENIEHALLVEETNEILEIRDGKKFNKAIKDDTPL